MVLIMFAEIDGSDVIPSLHDLCASFQHAVVAHLCKKLHRGMIYADMRKLVGPANRKLVSEPSQWTHLWLVVMYCLWLSRLFLAVSRAISTLSGGLSWFAERWAMT